MFVADFIVSNLLFLFVFSVVTLIVGLSCKRWPKISRWLLWSGSVAGVIAVSGATYVIFGTPGREPTVPEQNWLPPIVKPATDLHSVLGSEWDAAAQADWPVCELMAQISETTYLVPVEAEAKYKSLGFTDVDVFTQGSMIGYVLSTEGVSVIAFRGTDDVPDWVANLKTLAVSTPNGRVHRGFDNAYQSVSGQIHRLLKGKRLDDKVWVTGHSLGGALAVLCAYDLESGQNRSIQGLITFGQPMVGRNDFADHINSILDGKYAHLVNESDVVPRIPPSYRHCGSLVWYTDDMIRRSETRERLFAAAGDDEDTETEVEGSEEIEPLSEREFRQLQRSLRNEEVSESVDPDSPVMAASSPLIDDHEMALYLEKVRHFLNKLSE
jgi:pimeloyl-ACP methyl ester carboxylesterase